MAAAPEAPAVSTYVKEGQLSKSGGKKKFKHWDKRWFRLTNDKLEYLLSASDKKIRGTIPLDIVTSCALTTNEDARKLGAKAFDVVTEPRTYTFFAASDEETQAWMDAIAGLTRGKPARRPTVAEVAASQQDDANEEDAFTAAMRVEWQKYDVKKKGSLEKKQVAELLDSLNLQLKKKDLAAKFAEVDADGSGSLDFDEFIAFLRKLRERAEVKEVFDALTGNQPVMTAEQFVGFLNQEQGATVTVEEAEAMMTPFRVGGQFNLLGFTHYLTSDANTFFNVQRRDNVHMDMTQPLQHYWIASSHNTYCTGDQLKGKSAVEAYENALRLGCRCVELDVWDGPDGEPLIYHGHTLTSRIKFRDVIQAIKNVGFVRSKYPIILSLEVHTHAEQQIAMANIMREILGDMMPPSFPGADLGALGSPESLKEKVLLKGKMCSAAAAAAADAAAAGAEDDEDDEDEQEPEDKAEVEGKPMKGKKEKVAPELSALIHLKAVHFHGFEDSLSKGKCYEMSSFAETKSIKLASKSPADFTVYNTRQLSRIYPKGTRVDSSNLDPSPTWAVGSQIVALNYQTGDKSTWINQGKFTDNGCSGYLLKPNHLRNPAESGASPKRLTVEVLSGFYLPKVQGDKEVVDPYVVVSLHGVAADEKQFRTAVVDDNGFNPVWRASFQFDVSVPSVAVLLLQVYDSDKVSRDDFICYAAAPIDCLRSGLRNVALLDAHHQPLKDVSILCRFRLA